MNTKAYNQNYYRVHRERLLLGRSKRYQADPKYRASIARDTKLRARIRKLSNMDKVVHNGRIEVGYTLYTMSRLLGFAPTTLVHWKTSDILPPALYMSRRQGQALYPASNVYVIDYIRGRINSKEKLTYEFIRDLMTILWPRTFWSVREVAAYVKKANYLQGKDSRENPKRKDRHTKADWLKTL